VHQPVQETPPPPSQVTTATIVSYLSQLGSMFDLPAQHASTLITNPVSFEVRACCLGDYQHAGCGYGDLMLQDVHS
jgi:hypothetical protein